MRDYAKGELSMTTVDALYSMEDHERDADGYTHKCAWMDRAHFAAERQAFISGGEIEMFDGQVMAGCIPILVHRAAGEVHTLTKRLTKQIVEDQVDAYLIMIPHRGIMTTTQDHRSTTLEPGTFGIASTNMPLKITSSPDRQMTNVAFHMLAPSRLVNERVEDARKLCGLSFSLDVAGKVASELVASLYAKAQDMDRRSAECLAITAIDVLLREAQTGHEARILLNEPVGRKKTLRAVIDYIEFHCFDRDISSIKVANGCGISIRYLHQLLKDAGMGFSDLLWSRRLLSARQQLTDVRLAGRSISEIAYIVGFKNSAHFSRAFRRYFGITPRAARAAVNATPRT